MDSKMGVISIGMKNMASGSVAKKLALHGGIGVRYGCLCAHIIIKHLLNFTPFLEQFQRLVVLMVPPLKLQGFARMSFGIENTEADVDALIRELKKIALNEHYPKNKNTLPGNEAALLTTKEVQAKINETFLNIEKSVYLRLE
jgi:selenocysteine lyase/cysteine desulfurase